MAEPKDDPDIAHFKRKNLNDFLEQHADELRKALVGEEEAPRTKSLEESEYSLRVHDIYREFLEVVQSNLEDFLQAEGLTETQLRDALEKEEEAEAEDQEEPSFMHTLISSWEFSSFVALALDFVEEDGDGSDDDDDEYDSGEEEEDDSSDQDSTTIPSSEHRTRRARDCSTDSRNSNSYSNTNSDTNTNRNSNSNRNIIHDGDTTEEGTIIIAGDGGDDDADSKKINNPDRLTTTAVVVNSSRPIDINIGTPSDDDNDELTWCKGGGAGDGTEEGPLSTWRNNRGVPSSTTTTARTQTSGRPSLSLSPEKSATIVVPATRRREEGQRGGSKKRSAGEIGAEDEKSYYSCCGGGEVLDGGPSGSYRDRDQDGGGRTIVVTAGGRGRRSDSTDDEGLSMRADAKC